MVPTETHFPHSVIFPTLMCTPSYTVVLYGTSEYKFFLGSFDVYRVTESYIYVCIIR